MFFGVTVRKSRDWHVGFVAAVKQQDVSPSAVKLQLFHSLGVSLASTPTSLLISHFQQFDARFQIIVRYL